ncbi:MAG TPA: carboxypeptidase-like regulatory domain-containing protein [Longimicrobium sp.]|nr:carboxypeptidase-like regulatory domain-containing protein [Longimicrobium sp.]
MGPEHAPLTTSDRGAFAWPSLPPGEYTLVVARPGQPEQSVQVVLGGGTTMEVTVRPPSSPGAGH